MGRSAAVAAIGLAVVLLSGFVYAGYIGPRVGVAFFAGQLELSLETDAEGAVPFNYAGREGAHANLTGWNLRLLPELYPPMPGIGTRGVCYLPVWPVVPLVVFFTRRRK